MTPGSLRRRSWMRSMLYMVANYGRRCRTTAQTKANEPLPAQDAQLGVPMGRCAWCVPAGGAAVLCGPLPSQYCATTALSGSSRRSGPPHGPQHPRRRAGRDRPRPTLQPGERRRPTHRRPPATVLIRRSPTRRVGCFPSWCSEMSAAGNPSASRTPLRYKRVRDMGASLDGAAPATAWVAARPKAHSHLPVTR